MEIMEDDLALSENDEDATINTDESYGDELNQFPHVVQFICKLQGHIKWQHEKIIKLRTKLLRERRKKVQESKKLYVDIEVQTEPEPKEVKPKVLHNWSTNDSDTPGSLVEQVKQVAESAVQQTGFAYEETSGLYYDYNTGYYYDAAQSLYYDGNSGTYYSYDGTTKTYIFHSQVQTAPQEDAEKKQKKNKRKEERRSKRAQKDEAKKMKLTLQGENSEGDEPEEGECSDSDNNSSAQEISPGPSSSTESENDEEQDLAKTYPPCMRIIVKETSLPKLKVGSLFLVAYTGGSMGREGDHSVLIPDINISKHHAQFRYDEDKKRYEIIDLGSRNGTYLNGTRLSVSKQESEPREITHGSIVQIGSTKLLCHIHVGHETCGYCEPGLLQNCRNTGENVISSKKEQHRSELKRLKNKFGVDKDNTATASQPAVGYQDRAQARRDCVGSSNHHAKTQQSSVDVSIAKDNKGFKLLSKMGWSEGQSLGKDGSGRTEPVQVVSNRTKTGLGASDAEISTIEISPGTEKKQALWRKTQQRYKEISE
ncbi:angiogenic factor with G patch and FHA domains 1 isoform X2 [Orussus abietinus]|uniref:angiogenic factor with G patch and FHA domains 1 isoform X2 n=1 Tax=Orussus abietinus TaxID=222816 RepID=UPI0006267C72|nr:angiogenic factor with G patch and FHA domains 1 isoform X2 [Orussus abietinus]